MKTRISIPLFALVVALGACQKADENKAQSDSQNTAAKPIADEGATPVAKPGAARPDMHKSECGGDCDHEGKPCSGDCDHDKGECEHGDGEHGEEGHSCSGDTTRLTDDETVERTDEKGRKVLHAGKEFTSAPVVSVAELLSKPDEYMGKVVQVEGDISAMCTHKRGWMAVVAEDRSGRNLRIMTAPTFLVPPESIGKTAHAEGEIDVIEVPEAMAKHLSADHKLDEMKVKDGKVQQVVMHATGADFI